MLHGNGVQRRTDGIDQLRTRAAVVAEDTNFDQFMAFQIDVDFTENSRCQTGVADHDYRMQVVRAGF